MATIYVNEGFTKFDAKIEEGSVQETDIKTDVYESLQKTKDCELYQTIEKSKTNQEVDTKVISRKKILYILLIFLSAAVIGLIGVIILFASTTKTVYTDCYDVLTEQNNAKSGLYSVELWKSKQSTKVFCDMDTENGGWTVFQYRFNGSVDFYRNFMEYEKGFGYIETEFWLGLKSVQEMASQGKTELRLDLTAANGTTAYETFQNFYLDEGSTYTLHIDPGTGTAGDSRGLSYNNGRHFSTYDANPDMSSGNCAVSAHGGWWYRSCAWANLNGEYVTPGTERPGHAYGGMVYYAFQGRKSLKAVKMMFRRVLNPGG